MQGVIPNMNDSVLRNWIPNRRAEIIGHMRSAGLYRSDEAPEMRPFGGPLAPTDSIELSSTGDRIYYTTDGSDPRLAATAQNPLGSVSVSYTHLRAHETREDRGGGGGGG